MSGVHARQSISPKSLLTGAALLFAAFGLATNAHAQGGSPDRGHIEDVLKSLNRGRNVSQVAVSPDGKRLAWIEGARGGGDIRVAPVDDLKKSERVTAALKPDEHCRESDATWEPDSKALAFFSDCAQPGDQADLYLSRLDGGV